MIYYALLMVSIALIIFAGFKHYKHTHVRQLPRPRHR